MTIVLATTLSTSCSSRKIYSFNDPAEAIKTCREKLSELKEIKTCNVDDLSAIIKDWVYLRDSSYVCLAKKMVSNNSVLAMDYFKLTDSIRTEITRIAMSEKRDMRDILDLKIGSSIARDTVKNKNVYKDALSLFKDFDKNKTITDRDLLLRNYNKLLSSDKNILSNSGKISNFLKEEDVCFRSLMNMLLVIPEDKLQMIASETAFLFENLYGRVEKTNGSLNEYLNTVLSIRFNRRLIQNAKACADYVSKGAKLTEEQKANFRWMLIQPFTVLDEKLISVLTEEQIKDLQDISENLPSILSKVDGKASNPENSNKLSEILSTYFLKYYLKTVL